MGQTSELNWPDLQTEKVAPPGLFCLFGVSGDLAYRKIAPALYNLHLDGHLGENNAFVGISRRDWDDEKLRDVIRHAIEEQSRRAGDARQKDRFLRRWHYQKVEADHPEHYDQLATRLGELDEQYSAAGGRVLYIAMAPKFFDQTAAEFARVGLNIAPENGYARIVLEKPFGYDLYSARELNDLLGKHFREEQVYRIDHYLGKETAQNLLIFRFANALFDKHLHRGEVRDVQITTAEPLGMEGRRGPYYEKVGALRDMVQNHMLQLLALMTMDKPACLQCDAVRDARAALLHSILLLTPEQVAARTVRGQYLAGPDGPAYIEEEGVDPDSNVETFAAVKLYIDNDRWRGVPFYLRTGKRLAKKTSQIIVRFRREKPDLFAPFGCDMRGANTLAVRITPNEGITLGFDAKVPGARFLLRPVKMEFLYESEFASATPEAYEHLVLDVFLGEPMLFIRDDEIEAAWKVVDSIKDGWDTPGGPKLQVYEPGGWGPEDSERIFENPYQGWHPM
jgi:glucose-6-phosphate 1-dehydrogenase